MRVFKNILSAFLLAFAVQHVHAETDADTDTVYACASIEENMARLACYDEAVGRLKAAEEVGDIAIVTRKEVETVQKEAFGFSLPSLPGFGAAKESGEDQLDSVVFGVKQIERDRYGKVIVTLENGQVWRQTNSDRVSYSRKLGVESAEVKRAALGSYRMKLDGGRAFRVKRIE